MSKYKIVIIFFLGVFACSKEFELTDPATGRPPEVVSNNINGVCELVRVKQVEKTDQFSGIILERDTSLYCNKMTIYDSVLKSSESISFSRIGDSIIINEFESFVLDPKSQNVIKLFTREYSFDSTSYDDVIYNYIYENSTTLLYKTKSYNGSATPALITYYRYDSSRLVSASVYLEDNKTKVLESFLNYDTKIKIKPWMYVYPDSFESYFLLYGFKFGNMTMNPVKDITTILYDANTRSVIDTWITNYYGYVISPDGYVIQVSAKGDVQQGLWPGFAGTMRFEYKCK